jgi:hypothetical protein
VTIKTETEKSGNRGEWSELYVLLRLLGTGKLFAADEKLNRIEKMYLPIIKIIRENEKGGRYSYLLVREGGDGKDLTKKIEKIRIFLNDEQLLEISADKCLEEADYLLNEIKRDQTGAGAFRIERTEEFAKKIFVTKVKSNSNRKSDIDMEIHDINTGFVHVVGFSIKSKVGGLPTLLNASGATKFIYRIEGIHLSKIDELNMKKPGRGLVDAIYSIGGKLFFEKLYNDVFRDNLIMIDSRMPEITAQMLLHYYRGGKSKCVDLIELMKKDADISPVPKNFYEYKTKELLCAAFLGMKPAKPWHGFDEATGGYIVVKNDGDVVAYHLYNRDLFKNYLLTETKFDTPSTHRHDFGSLYKKDGKVFIDLCLQIRFC